MHLTVALSVWATRLSTSKPFFIRKHGVWVWDRYAAATSLALPTSDDAADVPARKNRIRIPWPSTKKEAKTPKRALSSCFLDTFFPDACSQLVRTIPFRKMPWRLPGPQYIPALLSTSLRLNTYTFAISILHNHSLIRNPDRRLKPATLKRK